MTADLQRWGPYLLFRDELGRRHLIRLGAVQLLADADDFQDSTVVVVAGRSITVPCPLDDLLACLDGRSA